MLGREAILSLLPERDGPCVSLYVPIGGDWHGPSDAVRFNNLLHCMENDLQRWCIDRSEVEQLLDEGRPTSAVGQYGREPAQGIAAFLAPGFSMIDLVGVPVPIRYRFGNHFHILPLLPLIDAFQRFFVLSLNQECVRFFVATPFAMTEIDLNELPTKPCGAPRAGAFARTTGNARLASRFSASRLPSGAARMRESGTLGFDSPEADLNEMLRAVDRKLHHFLVGETAPMLIAGFGFIASLYEEINSYQHLLPVRIPGSPSHWTTEELHAHAVELAKPYLERNQRLALRGFGAAGGRFGLTTTSETATDVTDVLLAAEAGRIGTLFVARDDEGNGRHDTEGDDTAFDPDGDDLREIAAARTLLSGGHVSLVDRSAMPERSRMAAMLRSNVSSQLAPLH